MGGVKPFAVLVGPGRPDYAAKMPVLPGSPPVDITLRRSARTRRFSLRVSRLDGRVTLSVPLRAREAEAMAFARSQESWLREALGRMALPEAVGIGTVLPVEGRLVRVVAGAGRGVRVEGDTLLVPGEPVQAGARVAGYLKAQARARLVAASGHYAGLLGVGFSGVTLRDTRSRWGSCSAAGGLMYSWRLVMAPPAVLAYVAAHEVAHRVEMNHSPAFWAVVERIYPGWQVQRRWLHDEGQALHSWRFDGD